MTGFLPAIRKLIIDREGGLCARCMAPGAEIHHRRPRGMGGSKDPLTNSPANGILLCGGCHRWAESNREKAFEGGWLVRQGKNPAEAPIHYRGEWKLLGIDGSIDKP
ncbi:HNH endonuclease [Mycobacterium phage Courthouse]|uniref:HNH endonuclease n=2 Tax=Omegavirus courthouse TaxID=1089119 RepID=G8I5H0_9CAUD|nr:HNH endonuclease [Mycobacterium phage Courthouse]YP_009205248.1 HNH endonuclease [Mycobacterium phage Ariel]ASZ74192.1 HNH endonuclease [Mycobacterium phage Squint]ATS92956.1 HNH endonuclease [Mycobacterium phage Superphikiman]AER47964.1 HNH endonuclease [Mycobacterium phage Courthouse]AIM49995.1 HNH endonuclease [Mycobacterium phage Ariel]